VTAATKKAAVAALTVGVLGALVMGMGMSLIMTNLGEVFGIIGMTAFLVGIPVVLVGAMLACIAYPLYNRVLYKERKKIAPEIIRLTDELMK
jgi:Na+-translocating ferredoxin:NAD+ oxidoreductase RnfE subunit